MILIISDFPDDYTYAYDYTQSSIFIGLIS